MLLLNTRVDGADDFVNILDILLLVDIVLGNA